jgi:hypothetical protein
VVLIGSLTDFRFWEPVGKPSDLAKSFVTPIQILEVFVVLDVCHEGDGRGLEREADAGVLLLMISEHVNVDLFVATALISLISCCDGRRDLFSPNQVSIERRPQA